MTDGQGRNRGFARIAASIVSRTGSVWTADLRFSDDPAKTGQVAHYIDDSLSSTYLLLK